MIIIATVMIGFSSYFYIKKVQPLLEPSSSSSNISNLEKLKIYSDLLKSIPGFVGILIGSSTAITAYLNYQSSQKTVKEELYSSLFSSCSEKLSSKEEGTRVIGLYELERINEEFPDNEKSFFFCLDMLRGIIRSVRTKQKKNNDQPTQTSYEIGVVLNILFRLVPPSSVNECIKIDLSYLHFKSIEIKCVPHERLDLTIDISGSIFENVAIVGSFFKYIRPSFYFNPLDKEKSRTLILESDLTQSLLDNVNLTNIEIKSCQTPLGKSKYQKHKVQNLNLRYCSLRNLNFDFWELVDANLFDCSLHDIRFTGSTFQSSKPDKCDLGLYKFHCQFIHLKDIELTSSSLKNISICSTNNNNEGKIPPEVQSIRNLKVDDVDIKDCNIDNIELKGCLFKGITIRSSMLENIVLPCPYQADSAGTTTKKGSRESLIDGWKYLEDPEFSEAFRKKLKKDLYERLDNQEQYLLACFDESQIGPDYDAYSEMEPDYEKISEDFPAYFEQANLVETTISQLNIESIGIYSKRDEDWKYINKKDICEYIKSHEFSLEAFDRIFSGYENIIVDDSTKKQILASFMTEKSVQK